MSNNTRFTTFQKRAPKRAEVSSYSSKPSRMHSVKLLLASGDSEGHVLLWDVLGASVCRYITGEFEKNKTHFF